MSEPLEFPQDALPCVICEKLIVKGEFFIVAIECVPDYVGNSTPTEGREGLPVLRRPVHVRCLEPKTLRKVYSVGFREPDPA